jgi:hypothetical protein
MEGIVMMQIDLGQARRRAKELLAAARAGDEGARGRLRADREPCLADAQRAVAADLGFASWPALVTACAAAGEEVRSEAVRTTELAYMPGRPVRINVRRRGHRYDIDYTGAAVAMSARPPGWRAAAERAVRELDWNINRDGVVFMQTLEGRDIDWFVRRTAEVSLAVLEAILDAER